MLPELETAHSQADTLQVFQDFFFQRAEQSPEQALDVEGTLLGLASRISKPSELCRLHNYLGSLYQHNARYEEAVDHFLVSGKYANSTGDHDFVLYAIYDLSNTYWRMSAFSKAVETNLLGIQFSESMGNSRMQTAFFHNLGNVHFQSRNFEDAKKAYTSAYEIAVKEGFTMLLGQMVSSLGLAEHYLGNHVAAQPYLVEALRLAEEQEDQYRTSMALSNLALNYDARQAFDSSLILLQRAYEIDQSMGRPRFQMLSSLSLGEALARQGKRTEARRYLQEGVEISRRYGFDDGEVESYRLLSEAMSYLGDYKSAYLYARRWKEMADSLLNMDYRLEVSELERDFQEERDQLKISRLERDGELAGTRYQLYLLGLGGGFVVLLAILLVGIATFRRRRSEAQRKNLELEHRLLQAQMNPHFLFNSLNTLRDFHLKQEFGKADAYLLRFSQMLRGVLENSSQSQVSLEDELQTLKEYIRIEQLRFDKTFEFFIWMEDELEPEFVQVPPLILQPFVENAILHGILPSPHPGKLEIKLYAVGENQLKCLIIDNGVGVEASRQKKTPVAGKSSRGIEITRNRLGGAERVKITQLEDGAGNPLGTQVELLIDLGDD